MLSVMGLGGLGWGVLTVVGAIAGGVIILLYVVAPLIIRGKQPMKAERELVPTMLEDLNDLALEGLRRTVHDLRPEGFEVVANFRTPETIPGSHSVQALFVHRATGDFAEGFFVSTRVNEAYTETWTLVVRTRFADGSEIATVSSQSPSAFPKDASSDSINPHWIKDGRLLYAIHRARVERSAQRGARRIVPEPGREAEFLREEYRRELQRVEQAGYFRLDQAAGLYWMTIKGAYLMTWRLLWPLKGLRWRARERKARRVLRELGFVEAAAMRA